MNEIYFTDVDTANVEQSVLTAYERIAETTLYPGDPVRLFLESLAYTIALQNNVINLAGRQNLLAYAVGGHLDYIGMMVGTARLGESAAIATQRFLLSTPLDFDVTIPAGTRVTTADGAILFGTDHLSVLRAGELLVDVPVTALTPGAIGNGLVPGQIDRLIDPLPYISATTNITASLLGADVESDERFRARIREAPEAYTCAGPVRSYRHHAMAVHQDIAEVAVWSPVPGTVDVRPVMAGGELPTEDILKALRAVLSADNVRPLTDTVLVKAPEILSYELRLTWFLSREQESLLATVQARVAAAVERYRLWQREKPGRDILPLKLASLLEQAGARRVELHSPEYQPLKPYQLARETVVSIAYGGLENE